MNGAEKGMVIFAADTCGNRPRFSTGPKRNVAAHSYLPSWVVWVFLGVLTIRIAVVLPLQDSSFMLSPAEAAVHTLARGVLGTFPYVEPAPSSQELGCEWAQQNRSGAVISSPFSSWPWMRPAGIRLWAPLTFVSFPILFAIPRKLPPPSSPEDPLPIKQ